MTITIAHYLTVSAILFTLGVFGIFLNRKNVIVILMSIELILLAVNLNFIAFSAALGDLVTHHSSHITSAIEADYRTEFLDLILAVKIVEDCAAAIEHIETHGSHHTETIVTADAATAEKFLAGIDSAVVLWNASTRFNDGHQFGFGAEIGISTDKLHARGPMGLEELTSYKYIVRGTGQGARLVHVLDPHEPLSAIGACIQEARERGDQRAEVQRAGGGGREAAAVGSG